MRNEDGAKRQEIISRNKDNSGCYVELGREPDNPHDENAISVWMDDEQIGYLSRNITEQLAGHIDGGGYVQITYCEITGGTIDAQTYGVNIFIDVEWESGER